MKGIIGKLAGPVVLLLVALVLVAGGGCSSTKVASVPFIPPEYYDCTQVAPEDLVDIYFTGYGDFERTEAKYDDKIYVFKAVTVDERMFIGLDEGFIWVDSIECYLVDPSVMDQFEVGDEVDVVGWNRGPTSYVIAGLKFDGCLVIPAGTVALPADPGSGPITPGY